MFMNLERFGGVKNKHFFKYNVCIITLFLRNIDKSGRLEKALFTQDRTSRPNIGQIM